MIDIEKFKKYQKEEAIIYIDNFEDYCKVKNLILSNYSISVNKPYINRLNNYAGQFCYCMEDLDYSSYSNKYYGGSFGENRQIITIKNLLKTNNELIKLL